MNFGISDIACATLGLDPLAVMAGATAWPRRNPRPSSAPGWVPVGPRGEWVSAVAGGRADSAARVIVARPPALTSAAKPSKPPPKPRPSPAPAGPPIKIYRHALPQPEAFGALAVAVGRRDSLDLDNPSGQAIAMARAARERPVEHAAWRSARCPAIDFAGRHSPAPSSYEAAVRQVAATEGLDLSSADPAAGLPGAMARAAKRWPHLHQQWRAAGFPPF